MYDIVNESFFDLEKSQEYILSIQVCLDGFSFSVVSPSDNKLLAFKKEPLEVGDEKLVAKHFKEWIDSNDIFQNSFKTIRIILFQEKFTIVPDKFISEELKNTIPSLLFSPGNEDFNIVENKIELSDTKLLFPVNRDLEVVLNKKFEAYKLIHPVSIISKHLKQTEEKYGFVLLFDLNNLYTILYTGNNIVLANSFKINHVNDSIYYTLAVLKQLKISPESAEVFYSGKIIGEKETIAQLENHFGSINSFTAFNPPDFDSEEFQQLVYQNVALFS